MFTALRYEGEVRRMILALKEQDRTDVARALSRPLLAAVQAAFARDPAVEIIAVPTSRAAYRRRGYDPVQLLLRRAGLRSVKLLRHNRRTSRQKTLGADERVRNLDRSMVATASAVGRRFVLVDDILTTGATLNEAARAVREAGGEVIGAATLGFTPKFVTFP